MIPEWFYNIIVSNREREEYTMNLDFVLDKVGDGSQFSLVENHPEAVSIQEKPEFYIKPTLMDASMQNNSKIILFSAPGATGKMRNASEADDRRIDAEYSRLVQF